jgi:outer membrane protein assembly factor BamA
MYLLFLLITLMVSASPTQALDEPVADSPTKRSAGQASGFDSATPSPVDEDEPPTTAEAVAQAAAKAAQHHFDWLAVPLFNYDSDYKFGYGAAAQLQWAGGVDPYRHELCFQVLFSTGGLQSHWINYDSPRFLGTPLRLWAHLEFRKEQYAPYYGLGNASSDSMRDHPTLFGRNAFTFDRTMPLARVGASYPLVENIHAFLFATLMDVQVRAAPGSLLASDNPYGIQGGHEVQFLAGFYRNTRDHEAAPNRGSLLEVSARGASRALGSSYTYGGLNARALGFIPVLPRLVLALRLEGDILSQGTPFFELGQFGGIDHLDGIGGQSSARGIPEDRYIGRGKVIGTVEARLKLASPMVRGEPLSVGVVAFADAGRVWQFDGHDGDWYKVHAGYGAGVRVWRRSFILRVDVATSTDRPFNFYILFGHFF